jgi:hypothetical protein
MKNTCLMRIGGLLLWMLFLASSGHAQSLKIHPWKEIHLQTVQMSPKTHLRAFSVSRRGDVYFADEGLNAFFAPTAWGA